MKNEKNYLSIITYDDLPSLNSVFSCSSPSLRRSLRQSLYWDGVYIIIQSRRVHLPKQQVAETAGGDPFEGVHLELVGVVVGFLGSYV